MNFDKTKVMIFGTRNDDRFEFKLGNHVLSICKEFKYLGFIVAKSRSFYEAIKSNAVQAKKARHLLYKRIRNLNLPIDLQIKLLDHTIVPILLYGCEVWEFQNAQALENVHNEFLRNILKLRKSTPLYTLHAELGRNPLILNIKNRMIGYWISIINGKNSKLSKLLYTILVHGHEHGNYDFKWVKCINDILVSVGIVNLFHANIINNPQAVKLSIKRTLLNLYVQEWCTKLTESSKVRNYSCFKYCMCLEEYLKTLPRKFYLPLCEFRTSNHKLPIETGRWENIPLNDRKCTFCTRDIGDEFHYFFRCSHFSTERSNFLKPYFYTRPKYYKI